MALKQAQLVVRGLVQGVAFRASTEVEAKRLGLVGWVKNRADGAVEICAAGEDAALKELIAWVKVGPEHGKVENVEVRFQGVSNALVAFRIVD